MYQLTCILLPAVPAVTLHVKMYGWLNDAVLRPFERMIMKGSVQWNPVYG